MDLKLYIIGVRFFLPKPTGKNAWTYLWHCACEQRSIRVRTAVITAHAYSTRLVQWTYLCWLNAGKRGTGTIENLNKLLETDWHRHQAHERVQQDIVTTKTSDKFEKIVKIIGIGFTIVLFTDGRGQCFCLFLFSHCKTETKRAVKQRSSELFLSVPPAVFTTNHTNLTQISWYILLHGLKCQSVAITILNMQSLSTVQNLGA